MWESIKVKFDELKRNIVVFILGISLLSLMSFILSVWLSEKHNGFLDVYLAPFLHTLAVAGFTAAVFQFLLKSGAFLEIVQKSLDIYSRQWKKYTPDTILNVLTAIKEAYPNVEFSMDEKELSYASSKKALVNLKDKAIKKDASDRTDQEKLLANRKFHINESRAIKTILLNGCEITTYEFDIEMIEDGFFSFNYQISTGMENVSFEDFDYFLKQKDSCERFSDYSFSAKILEFKDKNGQLIDTEKIPHLDVYIDKDDKEGDTDKRKNICISISQECDCGTSFSMSFSITTKDEYTIDNINKIKSKKANAPKTSVSVPVGVRHLLIQEEVYGSDRESVHLLKLRPWLKVSGKMQEAAFSKSIFYKKYSWTIYYSKHPDANIEYSVI